MIQIQKHEQKMPNGHYWLYRTKQTATDAWENTWFGLSESQAQFAIEHGWLEIGGEKHVLTNRGQYVQTELFS